MFFDRAKRIALRSRADKRLKRAGRVLATVILILGGFDVISTNAALASKMSNIHRSTVGG